VFGKVIENYNLVERISEVPTDDNDCPKTPIQMIRITIE
jgi:cyclophilin family peptidyl-prolyl cis-trans isomerase